MTGGSRSGIGVVLLAHLAGTVVVTLACTPRQNVAAHEHSAPVPSSKQVTVPSLVAPSAVPVATVVVPAGSVIVGSLPGDPGRDPTLEPPPTPLTLPAFAVDTLPYPGQPNLPPNTGVSHAEASALCTAKGGRLCTEVEWERICRGPENQPYPTGSEWESSCGKTGCTNGFGVSALGALEEWTADTPEPRSNKRQRRGHGSAAVRGAPGSSPAAAHRCASRRFEPLKSKSAARGFRCCYGPQSTSTMPAIASYPAFRSVEISSAELTAMLGSAPELARIRQGARLFKEAEALAVPGGSTLESSSAEAKEPQDQKKLSAGPILWSPAAGTEIVLMAGKSRSASWIVAFHRLPDGTHRLASSMIFERESGPIALAIRESSRREVGWSLAWDVPGETGAVTWRDDHRVVIVQR